MAMASNREIVCHFFCIFFVFLKIMSYFCGIDANKTVNCTLYRVYFYTQ